MFILVFFFLMAWFRSSGSESFMMTNECSKIKAGMCPLRVSHADKTDWHRKCQFNGLCSYSIRACILEDKFGDELGGLRLRGHWFYRNFRYHLKTKFDNIASGLICHKWSWWEHEEGGYGSFLYIFNQILSKVYLIYFFINYQICAHAWMLPQSKYPGMLL